MLVLDQKVLVYEISGKSEFKKKLQAQWSFCFMQPLPLSFLLSLDPRSHHLKIILGFYLSASVMQL